MRKKTFILFAYVNESIFLLKNESKIENHSILEKEFQAFLPLVTHKIIEMYCKDEDSLKFIGNFNFVFFKYKSFMVICWEFSLI